MHGPHILGGLRFSSDPELHSLGPLTRGDSTDFTARATLTPLVAVNQTYGTPNQKFAKSLVECTGLPDQLGSSQCLGNNLLKTPGWPEERPHE